ncbi:MAG: hypothetical protein WCJ91_03645 [Actinomycetes bacterium]
MADELWVSDEPERAPLKSAANDPKRKWLLLGIPLCVVLAIVELGRAFSGNRRSWVYVFEWPFFAIFIGYMYWKLTHPTNFDELEESEDE